MHEAALFATISSACFGIALVLTQYGLRYASPIRGASISIPSAALILLLISPLFGAAEPPTMLAMAVFAGVGLFFPALATVLTFVANQRLGPTVAGAIGGTAPLFAIAGAFVFLGEPLSGAAVAGTLSIVLGVAALSMRRPEHGPAGSRTALPFPIAAALIRAIAQTLTKYGLALWPSPFNAALIGYIVSSAVVLVIAKAWPGERPARIDPHGVFWFVIVGACNGAAVLTMFIALSRGPVTLVAPIVATYPFFTLVASVLFLRREPVTPRLLAGVATIVAGVIVVLVF